MPPKLLVSRRGKQFSYDDSTSSKSICNGFVSKINEGDISGEKHPRCYKIFSSSECNSSSLWIKRRYENQFKIS